MKFWKFGVKFWQSRQKIFNPVNGCRMRKVLSILFLVCIDSMAESGNRVFEEKEEDKNDIWKLGSNFRQISRKRTSSGGGQKIIEMSCGTKPEVKEARRTHSWPKGPLLDF